MGAGAAAIAAIDGAARLFEANGIWRSEATSRLYRWTWPVRAAGWLVALLALLLVSLAVAGERLPPVAPRLIILAWALLAGGWCVAVVFARRHAPAKRQARGPWLWSVGGAPVDAQAARDLF